MNARRIPFQFSTTDPVARQKELEKRFGLQPTCPKMYVDVNNPLSMGTTPKEISSPRLQHRVPIFAEGYDHPLHSSSVDSMASIPENKKPNVRVIPIEVEGAERSPRHRTYSGPAGIAKDRCGESPVLGRKEVPPFKRLNIEDLPKHAKPKLNSEPKVFNIPIHVEGSDDTLKRPQNCANKTAPTKKPVNTSNGCSQSKVSNKAKSPSKSEVKAETKEKEVEPPKNPVETELKKIEDVLNEFKTYETGVTEFTGTSKDKQYRYLDEMLTRCMLKLDEIDTMGNEQIRLSRKNAVKKIQASIDLLESKANVQPVTSTENNEKESASDKNTKIEVDVQEEMANDSTVVSNCTTDDKGQGEVSDNIQNQETDTCNEKESLKTEEKSNVTDVEMCDAVQDETSVVNTSSNETTNIDVNPESKISNLSEDTMLADEENIKTSVVNTSSNETANIDANPESKISNLSEDTMLADEENISLQQQQNDVPEVEMSEETSTNNAPSSELRSDSNSAKQDLYEIATNDVEMSDVKDLPSNSVENPCDESTKSSEVLEVEMDDTENNSCGEKESDCGTVNKSDCVTEKTDDAVQETVTELSQDNQSATSQSGNAESINVNKCSNDS